MKKTKLMLYILIITLILTTSCGVDDEIENKQVEIHVSDYVKDNYNKIPSSITSKIDIVIYDKEGREAALIYGDSAEFVEEDVVIQNMRVLFKSKDSSESEEENSTLISDYGKINMGKKIEAWGNVIMIKEMEYKLETEKIIWEKNENGNLKM